MNNQKFEPDLELAEAFSNLFFEIIMPSLIIMGYIVTTKKFKAVVLLLSRISTFEVKILLFQVEILLFKVGFLIQK